MTGMEFTLTEEQSKKAADWKEKHDKTCIFADPNKQGAIGGRITYCFTGTSLGIIAKIKCGCGEELDLTDYEEW